MTTQASVNTCRKADLYAIGKLVAARAQRERQGVFVHHQMMKEVDGIPVKEVRRRAACARAAQAR